jgi:uncharacterized delta-60 repeat protein
MPGPNTPNQLLTAALCCCVSLLFATFSAQAQSAGDLDPSFGGTGVVYLPTLSGAWGDITVQPDGKILVAGNEFAGENFVIRILDDGSLDPTFGTGGIASTGVPSPFGPAVAIEVQPDGKILLSGRSVGPTLSLEHFVARFEPDGTLDPSFDGDGIAFTGVSGAASFGRVDVGLQSDGKILLTALGSPNPPAQERFVVRFLSNGSVDPTFDGDGIVSIPIRSETAGRVVAQSDGKILVTSSDNGLAPSISENQYAVRFNPDGSLDTGFGVGGFALTGFPLAFGVLLDMALQPDGKIVLAGEGGFASPFNEEHYLVRLNPDGTLDSAFDDDGVASAGFPDRDAFTGLISLGTAIQADGKLLLSGTNGDIGSPGYLEYYVLRLNEDGSRDQDFGTNGLAFTGFTAPIFDHSNLALQPDGKILLLVLRGDLTVVRFLAENQPQILEIPALNSVGLILLVALLGFVAVWRLNS